VDVLWRVVVGGGLTVLLIWLLQTIIRDAVVSAVKPLISELQSIVSELQDINEKLDHPRGEE